MATIGKKYIENGQKVMEINAVSVSIKDCFTNAVKIANEKTDIDEFRMMINGCDFIFKSDVTVEDLEYTLDQHYKQKGL